jgi:hypothetical protein
VLRGIACATYNLILTELNTLLYDLVVYALEILALIILQYRVPRAMQIYQAQARDQMRYHESANSANFNMFSPLMISLTMEIELQDSNGVDVPRWEADVNVALFVGQSTMIVRQVSAAYDRSVSGELIMDVRSLQRGQT